MNYKHIYHAGNFADVAKHVGLLFCIGALQRKDAAMFVLDSHAGRGYYDLQAAEAHKSGEAERGVQRLIESSIGETALADYFEAIHARRGKRLARYPGSPALIAGALRPQDRALFVELMPAEARAADREVESLGRVRMEIGDGYAALKAFLPPEERRGLVLIDPPYESLDELKLMLQAFADAYRRWPSGIFLMWYPIRSAAQRRTVHARFEALGIPKMLFADLAIHPDDAGVGLAGSGLMIVNPPYGADEYLSEAYAAIHKGIATPDAGYVEVVRLTPRANGTIGRVCAALAYSLRTQIMDKNSLHDLLAKLHAEMTEALQNDPKSRESLSGTMQDINRLVETSADSSSAADESLPGRLERIAVQFEADHPTLAASARRLVDLLGEVGI